MIEHNWHSKIQAFVALATLGQTYAVHKRWHPNRQVLTALTKTRFDIYRSQRTVDTSKDMYLYTPNIAFRHHPPKYVLNQFLDCDVIAFATRSDIFRSQSIRDTSTDKYLVHLQCLVSHIEISEYS